MQLDLFPVVRREPGYRVLNIIIGVPPLKCPCGRDCTLEWYGVPVYEDRIGFDLLDEIGRRNVGWRCVCRRCFSRYDRRKNDG